MGPLMTALAQVENPAAARLAPTMTKTRMGTPSPSLPPAMTRTPRTVRPVGHKTKARRSGETQTGSVV